MVPQQNDDDYDYDEDYNDEARQRKTGPNKAGKEAIMVATAAAPTRNPAARG